jgi:hypothetical protein
MRTLAAVTVAVILACAVPVDAGLYGGAPPLNVYDGHGRLVAPVLGFVGDDGGYPQYAVIALRLFSKTYTFSVGAWGLGGTSPLLYTRWDCRGPAYVRASSSALPTSAVALGFLYTVEDDAVAEFIQVRLSLPARRTRK